MRTRSLVVYALAALAASGCRKSAREEEREAQAARARVEAVEREAADEAAVEEARAAKVTREAMQEADEEASEAAVALGREIEELKADIADELDGIDGRIGELREDIADEKNEPMRTDAERRLDRLEASAMSEREALGDLGATSAGALAAYGKHVKDRLREMQAELRDIEATFRPVRPPNVDRREPPY